MIFQGIPMSEDIAKGKKKQAEGKIRKETGKLTHNHSE